MKAFIHMLKWKCTKQSCKIFYLCRKNMKLLHAHEQAVQDICCKLLHMFLPFGNEICRCVLHYIASWTLCMRNGELCRLRGAGWLVRHWNLSWISRCSTSRKKVTLICHLGFDLCASMAATILKQGVPHVCDGLLNIFTVITKLHKMMLVVWCWLLHRF